MVNVEIHSCEYLECQKQFERNFGSKTKTCSRSHSVHLQYQNNPDRRKIQALNTSKPEVQDKKKITSLKVHGVENFSNFEKRKQTMLRNYGVETNFHLSEVQKKAKETNLELYGYENPFYSSKIQAEINLKTKDTLKSRYNVENPGQIPEVIEKALKTRETRFKETQYHSKPELNFMNALNIKTGFIHGQSIDGIYPNLKLLIEYDGYYYHVRPERVERDKNKTLNILSKGFNIVRIRENPLPTLDINNGCYLEIFIDPKFSYKTDSKEFNSVVSKINKFKETKMGLL